MPSPTAVSVCTPSTITLLKPKVPRRVTKPSTSITTVVRKARVSTPAISKRTVASGPTSTSTGVAEKSTTESSDAEALISTLMSRNSAVNIGIPTKPAEPTVACSATQLRVPDFSERIASAKPALLNSKPTSPTPTKALTFEAPRVSMSTSTISLPTRTVSLRLTKAKSPLTRKKLNSSNVRLPLAWISSPASPSMSKVKELSGPVTTV